VQTGGLREEARPAMAQLAKETGATTFLSVPGEKGALCLERIHGHDPVQVQWWAVGNHMPWNCGAGPRLLLAYIDGERVSAVARHFRALTPKSEMDPNRLRKHFGLVRKRGYEIAIDDVVPGLSAVAVPVRDRAGALIAALSVGGLTHLILRDDGEPRSLDNLRTAAAEIEAHLP
jgi:DNA-binding IclR family transcriptional regulator